MMASFDFLSLPGELRMQVYETYFSDEMISVLDPDQSRTIPTTTPYVARSITPVDKLSACWPLLCVCHHILSEARLIRLRSAQFSFDEADTFLAGFLRSTITFHRRRYIPRLRALRVWPYPQITRIRLGDLHVSSRHLNKALDCMAYSLPLLQELTLHFLAFECVWRGHGLFGHDFSYIDSLSLLHRVRKLNFETSSGLDLQRPAKPSDKLHHRLCMMYIEVLKESYRRFADPETSSANAVKIDFSDVARAVPSLLDAMKTGLQERKDQAAVDRLSRMTFKP